VCKQRDPKLFIRSPDSLTCKIDPTTAEMLCRISDGSAVSGPPARDAQRSGLAPEDLAASLLAARAIHHRTKLARPEGELDFVADESRLLVFVEVRSRRVKERGPPNVESQCFTTTRVGARCSNCTWKLPSPLRRPFRFDSWGYLPVEGGQPRSPMWEDAFRVIDSIHMGN